MKVTIFNGSPKGKNGNTHIMAGVMTEGMQEAGAEVENVFLSEMHIEQCRGCIQCFTKTPGRCCISDDMTELLSKYVNSDFIGLATPVFSGNMTAILKNFIDRTLPLKVAGFHRDEEGSYYHEVDFVLPKFFVISNCGFPGDNNFEIIKVVFSNFSPIAEIYRNTGELLKADGEGSDIVSGESAGEELISRIKSFKAQLKKAGYEIVKNGFVGTDTLNELNKPFQDDAGYVEYANNYFEEQRNQNIT